jgi:hypothetical protein
MKFIYHQLSPPHPERAHPGGIPVIYVGTFFEKRRVDVRINLSYYIRWVYLLLQRNLLTINTGNSHLYLQSIFIFHALCFFNKVENLIQVW